MTDDVMVSIWCPTYNQKKYIRDALEGFVLQKTNFLYKVIVFDDMSTDGTSDILLEYQMRYPKIFHVIFSKENLSSCPEKKRILKQQYLTGKYIALCDGDDYWVDCNKLQIQVDYMETHPECSMHIHNALWQDCAEGSIKAGNPYSGMDEKNLTAEEIIMQYNGHPPTASFLFRRELIDGPEFLSETVTVDYALQLYALFLGSVHYSNRIMSVYRWHSAGSYSQMLKTDKKHKFSFSICVFRLLFQYDKYTDYKFHVWLENRIQLHSYWAIEAADPNVSIQEYYNLCLGNGYYFPPICEYYFGKIEILRRQIFDMTFCSDATKDFVAVHETIVVMGAGNYSSIITKQFENNNINFAGYVVSRKENIQDSYLGKPVWTFSELKFDKEKTGIIIAIKPFRWDDIVGSLEAAGRNDYYCPFLLE